MPRGQKRVEVENTILSSPSQDNAAHRFPEGLLDGPTQARIHYFDKMVAVAHPRQTEAFDKLMAAIRQPSGFNVVFLVGPTGAGKTTILHKVQRTLLEELADILDRNRGMLPFCCAEAVAPTSGRYDWALLFKDLLKDGGELLIDRKIAADRGSDDPPRGHVTILHLPSRPNSDDLRDAFISMLVYRKPRFVGVDEGQHMLKIGSGRRTEDQPDCIKSLANRSGTLFVVMGTYDLLPMRKLNDQLSRRTLTIELPRYYKAVEADVKAFQRCLVTFEERLPVANRPDLLGHWEYLFDYSVGCIGTLKDWLVRALTLALSEIDGGDVGGGKDGSAPAAGVQTVTRAHLEKTALPLDDCHNIAQKARFGEAQLAENPHHVTELQTYVNERGQFEPLTIDPSAVLMPPATRGTRRRVGDRNPTRDPIGGSRDAG